MNQEIITPSNRQFSRYHLGLDEHGTIIQFNTQLQQITGYTRQKVLNKSLFALLVPSNYQIEWKKILDQISNTDSSESQELPLKTTHQKNIHLTWAGFQMKMPDNTKQIFLYGTNPRIIPTHPQQNNQQQNMISPLTNIKQSKDIGSTTDDTLRSDDAELSTQKKMLQPAETTKKSGVRHIKIVPTPRVSKTKNSLQDINHPQSQYTTMQQRIQQLEEQNKLLKNKNEALEKNLIILSQKITKTKRRLAIRKPKTSYSKTEQSTKEKKRFHKKLRPFHVQQQEETILKTTLQNNKDLEQQKQTLDEREHQLHQQQKDLDIQMKAMTAWAKKVQQLELEINEKVTNLEHEQQELVQPTDPPLAEPLNENKTTNQPETNTIDLDYLEQPALIIHRGLIRQVNHLFLQLLDYTLEDVLNKRFLSIVAPESFQAVENYYLSRLKKETVSSYATVLLTKNNEKINAEISCTTLPSYDENIEVTIITQYQKESPQDIPTDT